MKRKQGDTKKTPITYKNPLEAVKNLGGSIAKNSIDEFKNLGTGIFDELMGTDSYNQENDYSNERFPNTQEKKAKRRSRKKEFSIFNYNQYYEKELVKKQIKELTEMIKREMEMIKKSNSALISEVSDIEKLTINSLPDKPGIYHIRFLEIVLTILRSLRKKVSESKTWLQAFTSKKKKRGSAFVARSKKKGTQYSLSQELQITRATQ